VGCLSGTRRNSLAHPGEFAGGGFMYKRRRGHSPVADALNKKTMVTGKAWRLPADDHRAATWHLQRT